MFLKVARNPLGLAVADWVTAKSADGPKVAEWLKKHVRELDYHDNPHAMRRLQEWRNGGRVGIDALDRLLLRYHRHLWELPDDVWLDEHEKAPRKPQVPRLMWEEMKTRYCVGCGGEIAKLYSTGRRVNPSRYNALKFCSNACKFEGQNGRERAA